jgi:PRTRC system protein E
MFFTQINGIMNQGVDITLVIRKKEGQLMVSAMPKTNGLKDEAQNHIVPLTVTGTPEELDRGFLPTICRPIQKAAGLLVNMNRFEQQADKAAINSKAAKELKEKEAKEDKEKKEKYEKLMKSVAELEAGRKYDEALANLKQARTFATPQAVKSVD